MREEHKWRNINGSHEVGNFPIFPSFPIVAV